MGQRVTSNVHNIQQHGQDNKKNYSRTGHPTDSSLDPGRDCTCDSSRPDGCGGYAFIIFASVAGTACGCCGGGFGVVEFAGCGGVDPSGDAEWEWGCDLGFEG